MNEMMNEILRYLSEQYINNGGSGLYPIAHITNRYNQDSNTVGHYLVDNGWTKNYQFLGGGFRCGINMQGIHRVNPGYVDGLISKVVSTLGLTGNDWTSIMQVLDFDQKDFQIAHNLAKLLEDSGMIETQFRHNDVIIKLTFEGMMRYEENKPTFFS